MAKETEPDKIQLEVVIGGSEDRKKLAELRQEMAKLGQEKGKQIAQEKELIAVRRAAQAAGDKEGVAKAKRDLQALRTEHGKTVQAMEANHQKAQVLLKSLGDTGKSANELRGYLGRLRAELNSGVFAEGSAEYQKKAAEIERLEERYKAVSTSAGRAKLIWEQERKALSLNTMSIDQLRKEIDRLNTARSRLNPTTQAKQMDMYTRSINAAEERVRRLTTGLGPFARAWKEVKSQVYAAGAVITATFAAGGIVNGFRGLVRSASEYSDALADVRKTTGLSMPVVKALAVELGSIDTRTSRAELLALAADAGKLGLTAKDDVLAFVRAGNQINVALGEDLGEGAIKSIGKLVDLFKLKEQFGLEQAMLKVGSAVNSLGQSTTASEGYLVDFLQRMGGVAPLAGITIDRMIGLGATLDSLGQTSEVSSTVLSKLFLKLGDDTAKYAQIAGENVEDFKKTLATDAMTALVQVLEGSKRTTGGVVGLAESMADLEIDAQRAAGVLGVLINNTDRLRDYTEQSSAAFEEGTSVTKEYEIRNTNLAAQLQKLGKEFNKLFANSTVVEWMTGLVESARASIDWLQRNRVAIGFFLKVLATAAATWLTYRVAVLAAAKATQIAGAVGTAMTTIWRVMTGQITLASVAMKGFNQAARLNPFGLIIAGITAAIGLYQSFSSTLAAASAGVSEEITKLQLLHLQITTTNQGTAERKKLIEELKALHPELLSRIDAETASNQELAFAVAKVNQELINKAVLAREDEALAAQNAKAIEKGIEVVDRERALREQIAQLASKYNLEVNTSLPLMERALDLSERMRKQFEPNDRAGALRRSFGLEGDFVKNLTQYRIDLTQLRDLEDQSSSIAKRRLKLMEELGISTGDATAAQQTLGDVTVGTETESTEQLLKKKRTLELIAKRIEELKKSQTQNSTNTAEYQAYQREIEALEREQDRITGARQTTRQKKEKENLDQLEREYKEFQGRLSDDRRDEDERELAELDAKHAEILRKTKEDQAKLIAAKKLSPIDATTDIELLGNNQAGERAALLEKQGNQRFEAARAANERIANMLGDARSTRYQEELEAVEEEIALTEEKGQRTVELEMRRKDLLLQIYAENAEDAILAETQKWDKVITEQKEALEKYRQAASKDGFVDDGEAAHIEEMSATVVGLEQAKSDAIETINTNRRRREREALRREGQAERMEYVRRLQNFQEWAAAVGSIMGGMMQIRDAEIQIAEDRADAAAAQRKEDAANAGMSQEMVDMAGERTAAEIAQIEQLKAARRRAALNHLAVQAAMAVASGIASVMASPIPFPGNLLALAPAIGTILGLFAQAKLLLAAGDSASAAAQSGPAGSLNNIPTGEQGLLAKGDQVESMASGGTTIPSKKQKNPGFITSGTGGGVLPGNFHKDGGNTLYDNRTGRPIAEVEKDELMLVMSRKATAANADLIPSLLRASKEGKRITTFMRDLAMPTPERIQRGMRIQYMAAGGWHQTHGSALVNTPMNPGGSGGSEYKFVKGNGGLRTDDDNEIKDLLKQILNSTNAFPTEITATSSIVEGERRKSEYDKLKNLNRVRR